MKSFRRQTIVEQSAAHLRERLLSGQWSGSLPGVVRLSEVMQVSQTTMRAVLLQLEAEGHITGGGRCRSRRVVAPGKGGGSRAGDCGWASCRMTRVLRTKRNRRY